MTDRSLTANVQTEVTSSSTVEVLFVEIMTSTPARMWSGLGTRTETMPGESSQIWYGMGDLGKVESIIESSDRRRNGVNLTLSGVSADLLSIMLTEAYQGDEVKIWIAYLNSSFAIINDPVLLFAGFMDTMKGVDGDSTGAIVAACESREQTLERSSRSLLTDQEQQKLFPGDLGLEFVNALQSKQITWGSANLGNSGGSGGSRGGMIDGGMIDGGGRRR